MSESPIEWQEEVIIDSPVEVKMHYYGTEAEQSDEAEIDLSPVRHGFKVGECGFLVAEGAYAELVSRPSICSLPNSPSAFLGFINHRGDTVPVFHLGAFFSPALPAQGKWVLLIDQGSRCMGLLLSETPERLREDVLKTPEETDPQHMLPTSVAKCVGEQYQRGVHVWAEFDHRRFCQLVQQQFQQS